MRVYTRAGDLALKRFTFSDSQPHFELETVGREFDSVTIETAIANPAQLLEVALVNDVLRSAGYTEVRLDIRYLLGARMDRAIGWGQPFTLGVIARWINSLGFSKVRILDVHSPVAIRLIRNSENILPFKLTEQLPPAVLVCPDKGARERVDAFGVHLSRPVVYCTKKRDINTGALSGFHIADTWYVTGRRVIIMDDICDGGATFVGLAKELRKAQAISVGLYVTHGIFSKGPELEGIDHIYTTDSLDQGRAQPNGLTVIPISMKEIQ